ncbi:MAG: hypothetical protein NTZ33_01860 [Bacteroidetes bacterium]|nr:hypothetical protein [Bacteroidota bacterium]
MKFFFIVFLSFFLSVTINAQDYKVFPENDTSILYQKKSYPALKNIDNKSQFHLSAGASVTSYGKNTSFTKWVAPSMTYQLTLKLNLHVGTLIINGNSMPSYFSGEQQNNQQANPTQAFLFLSGDYQINNAIRLRATTFNELKSANSLNNSFNYNQIGVDIKLANNLFFSADFIDSRGSSPFMPFSTGRLNNMNNGFGNSLFGNSFMDGFR